MKTINLSTHSGYPHQLISKPTDNIFPFIHNQQMDEGDNLKVIIGSNWRQFEIVKILETRKPKGKHSDENAMWVNAEVKEVVYVP